MGQGVLVVAESGSGKSTSIETLDPKSTFIVNVANKPLPFKGWKSKYTAYSAQTNPTGNMYTSSDPNAIEQCIRYVNDHRKEVKVIVVDDFNYMSAFEYFNRANEKGYDKFTDIGAKLVRVVKLPKDMRDDLTVIYMMHAEDSTDLDGKRKVKAKTIGKMVDNALTLEGLFSVVLFGRAKKDKDGNMRYIFETRNNGENTCKTPKGMFDTEEIPNDLSLVMKAIKDYENDI